MDGDFAGDSDRRTVFGWLMELTRSMEPMESKDAPHASRPPIQIMGGSNVVVAGDVNITRSTLIGRAGRVRGKIRTHWRTLTVAAIKARCANDLGDADFYVSFVREQFGKDSLAELADAELKRVRQYVFGTPRR